MNNAAAIDPFALLLDPTPGILAIAAANVAAAEAAAAAPSAPRAIFAPRIPCGRCSGQRIIAAFRHVSGGVCFACDGTGVAS